MNYVIIVYFIEQITYNSDFTGDFLLKPSFGNSRKTFNMNTNSTLEFTLTKASSIRH
jgi:hypothetical protein